MDSESLNTVEVQALSQGIQFLFGQAGESLRRWRERRDGADPSGRLETGDTDGAEALANPPAELDIDWKALDGLEADIEVLTEALGRYAKGETPVTDSDADLLEQTSALRDALEIVFGQSLTLRGEQRAAPDEQRIQVEINVKDNFGEVEAVRMKRIRDVAIKAAVNIEMNHPGSVARGVVGD